MIDDHIKLPQGRSIERGKTSLRLRWALLASFFAVAIVFSSSILASQRDIHGPIGSGAFGSSVKMLSNGNFYVSDPEYDAPGPIFDVGAVHLYSPQGTLISTLTGSSAGDRVGAQVLRLRDYFLVVSKDWDNGSVVNAGAVTQVSIHAGLSGTVTSDNSIVGTTENERVGNVIIDSFDSSIYLVVVSNWDNGSTPNVGAARWVNTTTTPTGPLNAGNSLIGSQSGDFSSCFTFITRLSSGNRVLSCASWNNGDIVDAGAVIWANPSNLPIGPLSSKNALVGSSADDRIGVVSALPNGNYVIVSSHWDNGGVLDAGAVVWANGTTGITGTISASNALVGTSANSRVGNAGVTVLSNGNYLVRSPDWKNTTGIGVGAVTWGNGNTGIFGAVSEINSLVGSHPDDRIGVTQVHELANGNYVVSSQLWGPNNNGAVTWGNGQSGAVGIVSAANSLIGSSGDETFSVTPLSNGNYVVASPNWGANDLGALTWANGVTGKSGVVSSANSLVGSAVGDRLGSKVNALDNGNYVVSNPNWDNGAVSDVGAVTWFDGGIESTGTFVTSAANSLIGSSSGDSIGGCPQIICTFALRNGNYFIVSSYWDNAAAMDAGAVTWGNGTQGTSGVVSSLNSYVGSTSNDRLGDWGGATVAQYAFDNFIIYSSNWDNGSVVDAGALTWVNGTTGGAGPLSEFNSLVGSSANDQLGVGAMLFGANLPALPFGNDHYILHSSRWDNGTLADAGAITFATISQPVVGTISQSNSVLGTFAGDGLRLNYDFDDSSDQWVVGRPGSNIVTLFDFRVFANQFE